MIDLMQASVCSVLFYIALSEISRYKVGLEFSRAFVSLGLNFEIK